MSHQSTGYFYYCYLYEFESEKQDDSKRDSLKMDNKPPYRTAYYTPARQDHNAQTKWYKEKVRPMIEKDCKKVIDLYVAQDLAKYPQEDQGRQPNRFGRTLKPFDWGRVREQDFKHTSKLPTTTQGSQKGQPYGKEI